MVSFFGSSTSGVYGVHAVDIKKCVAMYYASSIVLLLGSWLLSLARSCVSGIALGIGVISRVLSLCRNGWFVVLLSSGMVFHEHMLIGFVSCVW